MSALAVHYGQAGYRAACGRWPAQVVTAHQLAVSCERCRTTVKFQEGAYFDDFYIETDEEVVDQ